MHQRGKDNAFSQYGTFNHSILEKYGKGEAEVYELLDLFTSGFCENVTIDFPPNKFCDLREKYFSDAVKFYQNFEGFDEYNVLGVEKTFNLNINNDFIFKGVIDLILEGSNNDIIILDHKSKADFKSKKERDKYARQLYLYSLYIKNVYGKYPKELIFNMFRKQKMVRIPFDLKKYEEAYEWMLNTVKDIRSNDKFEISTDDFMCKYLCNHRDTCEYGISLSVENGVIVPDN